MEQPSNMFTVPLLVVFKCLEALKFDWIKFLRNSACQKILEDLLNV
jgi:hypothetical protein